jgi:Bor protein
MKTRLALALALLGLAACQTVKYQTHLPESGRRYEKRVSFWLWGLGGSHDVDLDAACPEGAASWQNQQTAGDLLFGIFTLGIYSPRTIAVTCAEVRR